MSQEFYTVKKKTQKRMISEEMRASTLFPVTSYDADGRLFLCDDNHLAFGFVCTPLTGGDQKTEQQVTTLLNEEFPGNTQMQVINVRSPDINREMYNMLAIRENYHDPLLTKTMKERKEFLTGYTSDRMIIDAENGRYDMGYLFDLKLFITVKVPYSGDKPSTKDYNDLKTLKTKVKTTLQNIKLNPIDITANEWIRIMNTMFNWGNDTSWRNEACTWDESEPLCNQVLDYNNDIEINNDHIRVGDQYIKCLSVKRNPKLLYFGEALSNAGDFSGGLGGVRNNYMVVSNILFPEQDTEKSKIEKKRQFAVNQAQGPITKFVPILIDKKNDFDTLYDSIQDGKKALKIAYHVVVFGKSVEEVQSAATAARNFWRTNRYEIMVDKFIQMPIFINCLPFCCDRDAVTDLNRHKTLTAKEAAPIIPIFGEWKGTGTPHLNFISRNGQVMSFSLHDTGSNMNAVIAAQSGSGKSFLTNELILSYMSEGAQVWVIDAGKSYKKLSSVLKGDFVEFAEESNICMNPFEIITNYEDEEDTIVALICSMASPKGDITEFQIAEIKRIMTVLWRDHGKSMSIDHVEKACLDAKDQRVRDVGTQLFAFTSNGAYGKYFVGKNNVTFENAFSVLELDELNGRKHLRQVVLLQLIYQIQQSVFLGDRDRKKVVIVDEAWDLLKEGEISVFMEHAYRKFRKYGGSVVICTQSLNDLYDNQVGRAISENSATTMQLGQKNETIQTLKDAGRLDLTEYEFDQLRTVHTRQGVYSEIYIKSEFGRGIGRLIVSDFQKLLYSTKASEVQQIENLEAQGYEVADAINQIIAQRKQLQSHREVA